MTIETLLHTELWQAFEQQAKRERRKPAILLSQIVREYLESAEAMKLVEDISREARRSGYTRADAVRLVREHRREKRARRACS